MYKNILLGIGLFLLIGISVVSTYIFAHPEHHRVIHTLIKPLMETKESFVPQLPTIAEIYAKDHSWTTKLPTEHLRVLVATGDVIPARSVNVRVLTQNNFLWPYEKVKTGITDMKLDILFINLETPLLKNCQPTIEGMIFCGDARNVDGLKDIGVTVASLANNHAGNYQEQGVLETATLLQQNNIAVTGINGPLYQTIRGKTFAFLGYNDITKTQPGISNADEEKIKKEIADARQHADIVVVTYHWGVEYRDLPDERQIALGHLTIDAGADLVIGNHPHWVQPIEIYKGKLITYAHGNFVFDQMWSEKTKEGVVGKYTFYDDQLIDVEYFPLKIENYGQPYFLTGEEKQRILTEMEAGNKRLYSQ